MKKIFSLARCFERKIAQFPNSVPNVNKLSLNAIQFAINTIQNLNLFETNPLTDYDKNKLEEVIRRLEDQNIYIPDIEAALNSEKIESQRRFLKTGPKITLNEMSQLGITQKGTQIQGKSALDKLINLNNSLTNKVNISNST